MFADSVCDSGWSNRSRRGWTTLISFALQGLGLSCLLLLPMLYTQGLPRLALLAPLLVPAPAAAAPSVQHTASPPSAGRSNRDEMILLSPSEIPRDISVLSEATPPPPADSTGLDLRGIVPGSAPGYDVVLPSPPPSAVHHPPLSRMMEGNLILRVQPDYPALARQVRVQGKVVLRAMITRDGTIENLQVLSGHPMLVRAAVDAVRQWRYKPYVLNGEPVEVETEVTVNFILSGG